jgi:hypothetical protein
MHLDLFLLLMACKSPSFPDADPRTGPAVQITLRFAKCRTDPVAAFIPRRGREQHAP